MEIERKKKVSEKLLNTIYEDANELDLKLNGEKFQVMRICEKGVAPPETQLTDPQGKPIPYKDKII